MKTQPECEPCTPDIDKIADHFFRVEEIERQFEILAPRLDWKLLVALEPRLSEMLHDARHADADHQVDWFCGQRFWHRELKPQFVQVIGHCRPDFHPILGTSAAYELAYDVLWQAVPDCRDCPWCE